MRSSVKVDQIVSGTFLASMLFSISSKIDVSKTYKIVIKESKARSLDQNALMWMWLTILAEHFTLGGMVNEDGERLSKDDMHDIMRHKFLGYESSSRKLGQTVIDEHKLRSTAKLDSGDMHHYLSQIDEWANSHGCPLPHPEDCEYVKLREAQLS